MEDKNNIVLFKDSDTGDDITLESLFQKIYNNHSEKNRNIMASVNHLKDMIVTMQDAVVIMPSLVELQGISIKNDEQLIKLASLVQKLAAKSKNSSIDGYIMSSDERDELLKNYNTRPGSGRGNPASSE